MANIGKINVALTASTAGLTSGLRAATTSIQQYAQDVQRASLGRMSSKLEEMNSVVGKTKAGVDGATLATQAWANTAGKVFIGLGIVRGAIDAATVVSDAFQGRWEGVEATLKRLPFGIGELTKGIDTFRKSISGVAAMEEQAAAMQKAADEDERITKAVNERLDAEADVVARMKEQAALAAMQEGQAKQLAALRFKYDEDARKIASQSIAVEATNNPKLRAKLEAQLERSKLEQLATLEAQYQAERDAIYREADAKHAEEQMAWQEEVRKQQEEAEKDRIAALEKEREAMERIGESIRTSVQTPLEKYGQDIEKANRALEAGVITADEYARYLEQSRDAVDATQPRSARAGLSAAIQAGSSEAYSAIARASQPETMKDLSEKAREQVELLKNIKTYSAEQARYLASLVNQEIVTV